MADFKTRSIAKVMDLIAEGQVELVDGLKDVYLDKTAVQNADGSFNFTNVVAAFRPGTLDQPIIQGFSSTENAVGVNVQFTEGTPVSRTVTNTDIDGIKLTFKIPALFRQTDKGKIKGSDVVVLIEISAGGGEFATVVNRKYSGESQAGFEFSYRINVRGTIAPWTVRCTQLTDDSDLKHRRDLIWESYTEVIDSHARYPYSAIAALAFDSTQFASVPATAYWVRKIDVQVPTNYDETTREYSTSGPGTSGGLWDGTFKRTFSDNPAWLYFDLLTDRRYGAGRWLPAAAINKWELYRIAQYCDELVPDGKGGTEPRMTAFLYLQTPDEAFNVLQQLATIFRGIAYCTNGTITPAQDRPGEIAAIFTPANVQDGKFNYEGASRRAIHTVALVSWLDPDNFYQQVPEYVEHPDPEMITRYGVVPLSMVAIGCKSQGQAHRMGLHALYSEALESETVSFAAGTDALALQPFDLISIADPKKSGSQTGGRIVSGGTASVVLDRKVTLSGAVTVSLITPGATPPIVTRGVISPAGVTDVLQLDATLDAPPQPGTVWALSSDAVQPSTWRIIKRKETAPLQYAITALRHAPQKFSLIEDALEVTAPQQPDRLAPGAPQNLLISENTSPATRFTGVETVVNLSWDIELLATSYEVRYQVDDDNPKTQSVDMPVYTVELGDAGHYEVAVTAIRKLPDGTVLRGPTTSAAGDIIGVDGVPADIANLVMVPNDDGTLTLSWDAAPEVIVQFGGHIELRQGASWSSAATIASLPGTATSTIIPAFNGQYRLRAVTAVGATSEHDAEVDFDGASSGITVPAKSDVIKSSTDAVPVGGVQPWPFDGTAPTKFLRMEGSTYNVDDYPDLGALYGGSAGGTFVIADWTGVPIWGAAADGEAGAIAGDDERDLSHEHDAGSLAGSAGSISGLASGGAETAGNGDVTISGNTGSALGTLDVRPRRARAWWIQRALK